MSDSPIWFLYIIRGADKSLYTGITTDVLRRFCEHSGNGSGDTSKGAKALRGKRPLKLEYFCQIGNRSEALKIEYQVKQLSKIKKEQLITGELGLDVLLRTKARLNG
tara:strand:- start:1261 stop:1581 length:321 start_codon:yes stop_codon:yes gene_type:complete